MPVKYYEQYLRESGFIINPFEPINSKKKFKKAALSFEEFYEVFDFAFRRMSIVLNEGNPESDFYSQYRNRESLRNKSDDEIESFFHSKGLRKENRYHYFSVGFATSPIQKSRELLAESEFYPALSVYPPMRDERGFSERSIVRISYEMKLGFWLYLYESYEGPEGVDTSNYSKKDYLICNTNYLLKNLWHNFAHVVFHKWTSHSYHNFRGESRMYSDFEADLISALLLAHSYGGELVTDGKIKEEQKEKIEEIFSLNPCNKVFRTRNDERKPKNKEYRFPDPKNPSDYLDTEWRFRRTLCRHLTETLIINGLTPSQVGVYPYGPLNNKPRWRSSNQIIADINGVKLFFEIPEDAFFYQDDEYRKYFSHVCRSLMEEYALTIREDEKLRDFAKESLDSLFKRLGIRFYI